ncbi:hypothetical protein [Bacillus sp. Marseille-Q3570]|nr:hypothetical protein [Bacillus sp. Marseille-Q3570]
MNFPLYGGLNSYVWPIIGFSVLFAIVILIFTWVVVFKSFKFFF